MPIELIDPSRSGLPILLYPKHTSQNNVVVKQNGFCQLCKPSMKTWKISNSAQVSKRSLTIHFLYFISNIVINSQGRVQFSHNCNINKPSKKKPETWVDERNITMIKDYCS